MNHMMMDHAMHGSSIPSRSGFPVWLKYVPGISFRTDNGPFKAAMQAFVEKIVSMMKSEGLFEWQGGPIILAQVENEHRRRRALGHVQAGRRPGPRGNFFFF
jgi:hypothetical protein